MVVTFRIRTKKKGRDYACGLGKNRRGFPSSAGSPYDGGVRIVSLSPAATETLFALGKGKDIVAVDQFSNYPEEAKTLPHLKDHQRVDVRAVREYAPDLVLTATVVQEKLAADLKGAGLPVFHQDPRTLDAALQCMAQLGVLVEAEERMAEVLPRLRDDLALLKSKAKLLPRKAKVYCEEWHDPPMVSGNWVPDLLTAAGLQGFPIRSGELSRAVTLKDVQAFDPDVIVISWCGAGKLADKTLLTKREGWGALRAVERGQVFVIDDSLLNRPGPRLIQGAQQLYGLAFQALHGA